MTSTMKTTCRCGAEPTPESVELHESFRWLAPVCAACDALDRAAEEEAHRSLVALRAEDERQRWLQARLAVIPPEIAATDIDDPRFNLKLWRAVEDWSPVRPKWLGIIGAPGSCKTRCMGLLARKLIHEGRAVVWATACELQDCVEDLRRRAAVSDPARERLHEMKHAPVLVLDDLGKNTWPPDFERQLFGLIDHRKTHYLPVLWTANKAPADLLAEHVASEERAGPIFGRLIEASRQIIVK